MSTRSEAEENLRVIRSLMEKATVYRAISAPGALVGGLLSIVVAGVAAAQPVLRTGAHFVEIWIVVLVATAAVNLWLLRRDAGRRGEPFVSPGMRLALRAMVPALAGGALMLTFGGPPAFLASVWVLFYGISLLAASHFAPKSICWLGRAFFCAGATLLLGLALRGASSWALSEPGRAGHLLMGSTFGLFHLVYAALTWSRKGAVES